jgi:hypothetical protein
VFLPRDVTEPIAVAEAVLLDVMSRVTCFALTISALARLAHHVTLLDLNPGILDRPSRKCHDNYSEKMRTYYSASDEL